MKYKRYVRLLILGLAPIAAYAPIVWAPSFLLGSGGLLLGGVAGYLLLRIAMPLFSALLLIAWAKIAARDPAEDVPYWAAGTATAIPSAILAVIAVTVPNIAETGFFSKFYGLYTIYLGGVLIPMFSESWSCLMTPVMIGLFFALGWKGIKLKRVAVVAGVMALLAAGVQIAYDYAPSDFYLPLLAAHIICLALAFTFIFKNAPHNGPRP